MCGAPDDQKRYEILDGELVGLLLAAPVDVTLEQSTIVVPDLVFVGKERLDIVSERAIEEASSTLLPGVTIDLTEVWA